MSTLSNDDFPSNPVSLPVRLNLLDGSTITRRILYAGCTTTHLAVVEDGATRLIDRSEIHSSGITFHIDDEPGLLAA